MACWIRGCTTKGGKNALEKRSLFKAHTQKMFNNWCDSGIAARGKEFSQKCRICELHFQKDDIIREDVFHMTDGTTITMSRKKPKLKEDAVPSIFSSGISYCVNLINEDKQKEQQNRGTNITTQLKSLINCFVSVPDKHESDNSISHHEQRCLVNENKNELHTWAEILKNLKSIALTSEY